MKASSSIAVLMTCYNRVETTLRCLHSLFNQTIKQSDNQTISLDVWLVDDASPDQTGAKVKAAFPEVHVIEGAGGLFWCKGMRLAWDKAIASGIKYDFYLWLNDDVMLKTDALADVLRDYENGGGVVVGRMSSDETSGLPIACLGELLRRLPPAAGTLSLAQGSFACRAVQVARRSEGLQPS